MIRSCLGVGVTFGLFTLACSGIGAPSRPVIGSYRVEENWTVLRDPALRTGALDSLKYVPLTDRGDPALTLGGEARHRWEYYHNDGWGTVRTNDGNGYHLIRLMLHADVRWSQGWRVYGEVKSGLVEGSQTVVKGADRDILDLHQAFLEWRRPIVGGATVLVRAGRQELSYGSNRIVTFRDGPNVRQSFDAGILRIQKPNTKWDLIYGRPAETRTGNFDDRTNKRQLLYGIYQSTTLGEKRLDVLDLYWLGYVREGARYQSGTGREDRKSLGARFAGKRGAWDYNFEALWQWGQFRDQRIRAWTVASDTGYSLATAPTKPRLFLKANLISGDRRPTDHSLNTFNALFPRGAYFGDIGLLGPANLINLHPGVSGKISKQWSYSIDTVFYWRESTRDGLFNAAGALIRQSGASEAPFIGTQYDGVLTWSPGPLLSVELSLAHFSPGAFLRETQPAKAVDYAALTTRFRF